MDPKATKTKIAAHYDKFTKTMHWVINNRITMSIQMSDGQFVITSTNKKILIDRIKDFKQHTFEQSIIMMQESNSTMMDKRLSEDMIGFAKILIGKFPYITSKQHTKKSKTK